MPARDVKKNMVRGETVRRRSAQRSPTVSSLGVKPKNAKPTSQQRCPANRHSQEHRDIVVQKNLDECNQILDECWVYALKEREMLLRMFGAHPWALFEVCHNQRLRNRDRFAEVLGDPDLLIFYEQEKTKLTKRYIAEFCEAKRLEARHVTA